MQITYPRVVVLICKHYNNVCNLNHIINQLHGIYSFIVHNKVVVIIINYLTVINYLVLFLVERVIKR